MDIGFIGLGIMGRPMAKNLLQAGHALTVFNRSRPAMLELEAAGARMATSVAELAQVSGLVITMLPNSPDVRSVVLGEGGVLQNAVPGLVVVDMSSIAPHVSREVYEACRHKGVAFLDAPVSGGQPRAVDGTLSIMAGGDEAVFERVKDVLLCMGASAVYIGGPGSGNVAKLANQMMVALHIAAMGEAMVFAQKSGVDPRRVYEAVRAGMAGSAVLDAKMDKVLAGDFQPGFRVDLHTKDLQNALDAAHRIHSPAPLSAGCMEMLQALMAQGYGQDDHASLVRYYEKLACVEVRA